MKELLLAQSPVYAADTSLVSEPSFPYTGAYEGGTGTAQDDKTAIMDLTVQSGDIKIGETVKIDVTINTSAMNIKEYRIKLLFPKNLVQVQDSSSASGIQVNFLESSFTKSQNIVNNVNGTIELKATTTQATTVNRKVAEISVKGISAGSVQITSDNTVSLVIADDDSQVGLTTAALNMNVSAATIISSSSSSSSSATNLPNGGIVEDMSAIWIPTFISLLLIVVGIKTFISGKKYYPN